LKVKLPNDRRIKIHCSLDSKEIFEIGNENEINMNKNKKRQNSNRLSTLIEKPPAPSRRIINSGRLRENSSDSNGSERSPPRYNPFNSRLGGQSSTSQNENNNNNNNNNTQDNIDDKNENNNNNNNNNINGNNNTQNNNNNNDYQLNIELEPEYSLAELISFAKEGIFPKKSFNVANKLKTKTQISHFFSSTRIFKNYPKDNVEFICKEKGCKLHEPFSDLSNLNKHFTNKPNDHPIMKKWYELYKKKSKASQEKIISDSTFTYF